MDVTSSSSGVVVVATTQRAATLRSLRRLRIHSRHVVPAQQKKNSPGLEAALVAAASSSSSSSSPASITGVAGYQWRNWAGIHTASPKFLYKPTSARDIIDVLALAKRAGERVKVIGTSNSPSDIAVTDGFMISLENYRRVLHVDRKAGLIKVEAGLPIQGLIEEADKHGLALSNLGSITRQAIAGALSTGTHGTGIDRGILATMVRELDLIAPDGRLLRCSSTERPDLFNAARCGLGALGVISTVTLQLEPSYNLHAVEVPMTLEAVLSSLNTIVHGAEHARFWWVPHTNRCWVWQANRTALKPTTPRFRVAQDLFHWAVETKLYELLLWLGTFFPRIVPFINRLYAFLLFRKRRETVDRSDKQLTFDCLFQQHVSEWAIPVSNTATALLRLKDLIRELGLQVHFSVEVRFTKADDIWLSPSFGRDSAWIGIIMYRPYGRDMPGTARYFAAFEDLMKELDGRPHWAKAFAMTPDEFRRSLPRFDDFGRLRQELDPTLLFTNAYLDHLFPPSSSSSSASSSSSSSTTSSC